MKVLVLSAGYRGQPGYTEMLIRSLASPGEELKVARLDIPRARAGATVAERSLQLLNAGLGAWRVAITAKRYDRLVVGSSPPLGSMPMVLRHLVTGEELVLVHLDIFPQNAEAAGILKSGPLLSVLSWVSRLLAAAGDHHVTLSPRMAETLHRLLGSTADITVARCPVEAEGLRFVPRADNAWRHARGWGDDFVVMYAGNLGMMYDFRALLAAAQSLAAEHGLRFAFVGTGQQETTIRKAQAQPWGRGIELLPPQAADRLSEVLSAGDLHVVPLHRGLDRFMWPSKLDLLVHLGVPCVLLGWEAKGCGARTVTPEALPEAILELRRSREGTTLPEGDST